MDIESSSHIVLRLNDILAVERLMELKNIEQVEHDLKGMVRSKGVGYKSNMLRAKAKKATLIFLKKYYPIEEYPEKWI